MPTARVNNSTCESVGRSLILWALSISLVFVKSHVAVVTQWRKVISDVLTPQPAICQVMHFKPVATATNRTPATVPQQRESATNAPCERVDIGTVAAGAGHFSVMRSPHLAIHPRGTVRQICTNTQGFCRANLRLETGFQVYVLP